MYDDTLKRCKELEGLEKKHRKSIRKLNKSRKDFDASGASLQNSFTNLTVPSTVETPSETKRLLDEKSRELEESTKYGESLKSDLDVTRERESTLRSQIRKLQDDKDDMQLDLEEMANRMETAEKRLINDTSSTMGLQAREMASRNKILKLESEKKALEKEMERRREAGELIASGDNSYDSEEDAAIDPKLKKSKSTILKLQKQLVETKLEIEESKLTLESERRKHDAEMERLVEKFEEAGAAGRLGREFERFSRRDLMRSDSADFSLRSATVGSTDDDDTNPAIMNLRYQAEIMHLQTELDDRDEDLRRKEEDYQMQLDQVDSLREQLQEALTTVEDLEFERNFNSAKVQELKSVRGSSDDEEDLRTLLQEKAELCAELETKLKMAEREVDESIIKIQNLQEEKAGNKEKVAELSEIWNTQAKDEVARNQILAKALQVAAQLNEAVQHIQELENENLEVSDKARQLGADLTNSMRRVEELSQKLQMEQKANAEMAKALNEANQDETIRMLMKRIEDLESKIGRHSDEVRDSMSDALSLSGSGRPRPPSDMVKHMIRELDHPSPEEQPVG